MNPHHDAVEIRALDASEPYDVCIIGSGPAGTILGTSLVERGIRTLILESGTNLFRWLFDRRLRFLYRLMDEYQDLACAMQPAWLKLRSSFNS